MIPVADLVDSLGAGLVRLVVPEVGSEVDDVALAEPGQLSAGEPGDLVFGVGLADAEAAVDLVRRVARAGAGGLVLRRGLARGRAVRAAARSDGVALVELADNASLAHVLGLVRGVIDRASAPGLEMPDSGVHSDLFTLADAVAALVDAPVTIEDAQSRVLAYSSRQDVTDSARVSTIVGRRVPEGLIDHLRAKGVFRRMARSDEPFLVQPGPTQTLPRLVVPVRAGGEWLGSIWVVVREMPPDDTVREVRRAATVLALHLLRLRAQADLTRRVSADRLRTVLSGNSAGAAGWLQDPPWRVVALARPRDSDDAAHDLDLWESVFRRHSWHQPLITDLDGVAFAVVTTGRTTAGRPGSWDWLRKVASVTTAEDGSLFVTAGGQAHTVTTLSRSRGEAAELFTLRASGRASGGVVALEDAWAAVTLARAAAALGPHGLLGGPLPRLREHDETKGTAYLPTLAAWLDHVGEPRQAARALHVHANTLRYRMQRMAEVAPTDLSDPTTRLVIRLQLAAIGL